MSKILDDLLREMRMQPWHVRWRMDLRVWWWFRKCDMRWYMILFKRYLCETFPGHIHGKKTLWSFDKFQSCPRCGKKLRP